MDLHPTMPLKFNNDLFVFRIVSLTHLDYPIASWGVDTTQGRSKMPFQKNSPKKAMWGLENGHMEKTIPFRIPFCLGNHEQKTWADRSCQTFVQIGTFSPLICKTKVVHAGNFYRCRSPVLRYCSEQDLFVDTVNRLRKD